MIIEMRQTQHCRSENDLSIKANASSKDTEISHDLQILDCIKSKMEILVPKVYVSADDYVYPCQSQKTEPDS